MSGKNLAIIQAISVWRSGDALIFDRKFYDGMKLYQQYWPGEITCIITLSKSAPPIQDVVKTSKPSFKCILLDQNQKVENEHLKDISIVLASADENNNLHLSKLCKNNGIKCVYNIEHTLNSRIQILSLTTKNPLIRLRRYIYAWRNELKRKQSFKNSDGIQMNGVPAHIEYMNFKNSLLYFDTRTNLDDFIKDELLESRLNLLKQNKPLRLAFSGRLIEIKGALDLIQLASDLKRKGMEFTLTIYGTGELDIKMKALVKRNNLDDVVIMKGVLDFKTELMPKMKNDTDMFVCLHKQGDPSCTYLETLSCGVPIIGYDNQALAGILDMADVGWACNLNDLKSVSKLIYELDSNRSQIEAKSRNSVMFASKHDSDSCFKSRIEHLRNTLNAEQ